MLVPTRIKKIKTSKNDGLQFFVFFSCAKKHGKVTIFVSLCCKKRHFSSLERWARLREHKELF